MPTSTAGSSTEPAGFTLIELAMVMVLLSLFTLLSLPVLNRLTTSDLATSARRLSGTVKYLFNEAALTGLEHRLIYDLEQGSYRAQVLDRDGTLSDVPGSRPQGTLEGDVRFRDLYLPGRGRFSTGQVTTRILPGGWIDETIIHLAADGGERLLTLHVMPLTGTTELFEGDREFR